MDDKATAAIQRVVNNTENRTGFAFEFLAPLLLNLLAQWLKCNQPAVSLCMLLGKMQATSQFSSSNDFNLKSSFNKKRCNFLSNYLYSFIMS